MANRKVEKLCRCRPSRLPPVLSRLSPRYSRAPHASQNTLVISCGPQRVMMEVSITVQFIVSAAAAHSSE